MNKGGSSGIYDRCLEKTPEQLFVGVLRREFELSPAASLGILEAAKEHLFSPLPETAGKVRFICASGKAKHGKPLDEQDKVSVTLTLDGGIEDLEIARSQGTQALRQHRVLRLTQEAYDQGGLLTQEDLARALHVSDRTVRADVKSLIKDGNTVHTRGYDRDKGRGVSHKTRIIDLYLKGYTYADIMRVTRHSGHSVKRYVLGFGRLLLLKSRGPTESFAKSEQETDRRIPGWRPVAASVCGLAGAVASLVSLEKRGDAVVMTSKTYKDRYESIPKRNFHNAIIKLCEESYKIPGSRKVLTMLADDIVELHKEFYPEVEQRGMGWIVWRTTQADGKKPAYGTRAEDYQIKTVVLPLVTEDDVEARMVGKEGKANGNYIKQRERDMRVMVRLIKSEQGGILSGAEVSVLLNRSLTTVSRYLKEYQRSIRRTTKRCCPLKVTSLTREAHPVTKV